MSKIEFNSNKLLTYGKAVYLALDHGLEHGPSDFNIKNVDPDYVLNIADRGKFNAIILQKGLAMKYYGNFKSRLPLIIKLNGKTKLPKDNEPYSGQICSVSKAVRLGATAVGYTIYFGSPYEEQMLKEFSKIEEEAHDNGLPVVVWAYPRGPSINDKDTETLAYSARAALELGADFIKIKYNNDKNYDWVVKCAGKAKLFMSGGEKENSKDFLNQVYNIMKAGAYGIAVGRNVWQSEEPFKVAKALRAIVLENKTVGEAIKF